MINWIKNLFKTKEQKEAKRYARGGYIKPEYSPMEIIHDANQKRDDKYSELIKDFHRNKNATILNLPNGETMYKIEHLKEMVHACSDENLKKYFDRSEALMSKINKQSKIKENMTKLRYGIEGV